MIYNGRVYGEPRRKYKGNRANDNLDDLIIEAAKKWAAFKQEPIKLGTDYDDCCWEWLQTDKYRYGRFYACRHSWKVHRLSWVTYNGPIPEGLHVLHSCDNPPCWRPSHLFLGTQKDNIQDCIAKGRNNPPGGDKHWKRRLQI